MGLLCFYWRADTQMDQVPKIAPGRAGREGRKNHRRTQIREKFLYGVRVFTGRLADRRWARRAPTLAFAAARDSCRCVSRNAWGVTRLLVQPQHLRQPDRRQARH